MRMATSKETTDSKEKLASDFKYLVKEAEALLRTTGDYAGEGFAQARTKFEERLNRLKDQFPDAPFAMHKYRQAAATTDRYVRDNPWQIIGAVAAISILVGFLTARR